MITIRISEPIPSLNKTLSEHWSQKTKRRNRFQEQVTLSLLEHYKKAERDETKVKKPKSVHIHSQRMRTLDHDNLVGGSKSLIDALKRLDLIVDDTPEWILAVYTQGTGRPYYTNITIRWD